MIARRPTGRAHGFTLVEVLVALVIVAFGMGAVLTALTSAADSESRLREKTFAEWVGLNQLATERLRSTQPSTGTKEGDATLAGMTWHWQETVENMDIPGIRRITIRVRPTFEYGSTRPQTSFGSNHARFIGAETTLRVTSDIGPSYILNETPFLLTLTLKFNGDTVQIDREMNVGGGAKPAPVTGKVG